VFGAVVVLIVSLIAAVPAIVTRSDAAEPAAVTRSDAAGLVSREIPALDTVWAADMADGGSGFLETPWENDPLPPAFVTSSDGSVFGKYAVPAYGSRCENVADFPKFQEGQEYYFSFSTHLPPEVPIDSGEWQVIAQWKNDGLGSPPLALALSTGRYQLTGGYGWPGVEAPTQSRLSSMDLGPAQHSTWDRWVVRVLFSSDAAVGSVDAWRNGRQVVADWHPAGGTLYPDRQSYLKVGYYRSPAIPQDAYVLHHEWTIGVPARNVES
jgi:hypothetical protein